jgi:putative two-component system response regulator
LVIDDNDTVLKQIASILSGHYEYSLVRSADQAVKYCLRERPDLVLLDIEMPGKDGFECLRLLKLNPDMVRVPIIFLTSKHDRETEVKCLQSGARDFIRKPAEKNILLHRLETHLSIADFQGKLSKSVVTMSNILGISVAELIECRDENTGGHVIRTSLYVEILGKDLLERNVFEYELNEVNLELIVRAAPLHDIGKISISDKILLKRGKLDQEEFSIMKGHAAIGANILEHMYKRTPTQDYLKYAALIASSHHERYDGHGYPYSLKGDQIPLSGRIMAVADVYDALVANRVYRDGRPHGEAAQIIYEGNDTQFDPRVVEAFERCEEHFKEISSQKDFKKLAHL